MINDINPGSGTRRTWLQHIHLDGTLLFGLLTACCIGAVVLYSASGSDLDVVERQALRLTLAFCAMTVIAQIPPRYFLVWTPWLFSIGVTLLAAVLAFGDVGKGAQRWLDLGFVRFQPSEMMKLAVPMMLAWFFANSRLPPSGLRLLSAGLLVIVPVGLIAKQPDLGTSLMIASSGFFVLFLAGMYWRVLLGLILSFAAATPVAWYFMHDYQRQRVITFLNPEHDPLGTGYHIIQSKIAIGSGGLYGKGWMNGSQSHLEFLPERSTDFIFAVLAEEFGLIGILILLTTYGFIMLRSIHIATQAQDTFTRLLAGSIALTFGVYVLVNTGMVTGLLPVVGVPLPLISYGGTSMVTLMAGFGILMSIHTHRKLLT